jgi:CRISPR-associated protein Cas1
MLSLPDFNEKKIIFISHLGKDPHDLKFGNSNIRLYRNNKFTNQISYHLVFCIFIIGDTTLTTNLIREAQKYGISIFLLNRSFQTYSTINSQAEGNYQIRQIQYQMPETESLRLAKIIVGNKIANQSILAGHYGNKKIVDFDMAEKVKNSENIKQILGWEGICASLYFKSVFSELGWYRRSPQTKEDIPNFLLDVGYSFLFNYVDAVLRLFGFDTYKGFYHQLFFERKSLSCDLMEPLRPIIDKQLIKAYHLKQVKKKDFIFNKGRYLLKKDVGVNKKYTKLFAQTLMDCRTEIYQYLASFYYHLLNPNKYPTFYFNLCL